MPPTPESLARENIDAQLVACGWTAQDRARMNLYAGRGVAVREFPLQTGFADYLLFVDKKAVGVIEAKAEGITLSGVAEQAGQYSVGFTSNPFFAMESNPSSTERSHLPRTGLLHNHPRHN
jgi:type I restriction enzyme, R subunit